jgi:hypothetical protein
MTASTVNGTLFTAATAYGFLGKVAFGTTIVPFSETIATTSSDEINDRVRLVPLIARGGKNRIVAVLFQCAALDSDSALRAKLVINQNSTGTAVDTDLETAANYGAARALTLIVCNVTLDDTAADFKATLDLLVTTAGTSADSGVISGLVFYE